MIIFCLGTWPGADVVGILRPRCSWLATFYARSAILASLGSRCNRGFVTLVILPATDSRVSPTLSMSEILWLLHPYQLIRSGPHKSRVFA